MPETWVKNLKMTHEITFQKLIHISDIFFFYNLFFLSRSSQRRLKIQRDQG